MPFIAIEGGEGVGKTTQLTMLRERLPEKYPDRSFLFTREPGGSPYAEMIRGVILRPEAGDADALTLLHLYAAARTDHVRRTIKPALDRGEVVITDRFFGSTFAYQLRGMGGHELDPLFDLHVKTIGLIPDLTIILDMDPRVALSRIAERAGNNHFDDRELPFHTRLRTGYTEYAARLQGQGLNVEIIEANRAAAAVHGEIRMLLNILLNTR
jgi:dTMP kinase